MREVQATEAKARLASLLRVVEAGETIAITRHGQTIAHLVPASVQEKAAREKKVEAFKKVRRGWKKASITAQEAMEWRHEGHRR